MKKGKAYINGVCLGECEFKITPDPLVDVTPIIVMFDNSDINNWRLYATMTFKGNPNDIIGIIENNVFTFIERPNISILDYEFIVRNSTHEGFEVNSETEYKIKTV